MHLPCVFPDELLLSRLIRYVTVSGNDVGDFTGLAFGSSRISVHPFLTAGLDHLARVSGESAEILYTEQTLAPLFSFYLPAHADQLKKYTQCIATVQAQLPDAVSSSQMGSNLLSYRSQYGGR